METNKRFIGYLAGMMLIVLWFALSPSRETRIRVVDEQFKLNTLEGAGSHKYTLSLALEEGKTYRIEERTKHTATTRKARSVFKNTYEVLALTEYATQVTLDLKVISVNENEIRCLTTMVDFIGYEEINDSGAKVKKSRLSEGNDEDDELRQNRNKEMFSKVREETKGIQFEVILSSDGTVKEMHTEKLRKAIIAGLHAAGQLPMHLEHAVLIGGYDVYPANGASFGPRGRTNVRAPVYFTKGFGCDKIEGPSPYRGRILVLSRGECTFELKAKIAAENDAAAIIVVDQDYNEGAVMTYMSGEDDSDIVAVIVNREAAKAIEDEMRLMADFVELQNGDLTASGTYLVEILGGVEAVEALNEEEFEEDSDEEDDHEVHKKRKRRSHHLNPIHSDGLHDFVGIGYVVDEVIRSRFSIFPSEAISIGASWERTLMMSDGIDPDVQSEVNEKYKLISISRAQSDTDFGKKGDLIAEISFFAKEIPQKVESKKVEVLPIGDAEGENPILEEEQSKFTPQFSRPSFQGHEFSTSGTFQVHVNTGFVISGRSTATSSSERFVVLINQNTGKKKTLRAKIDLKASTNYRGQML